MRILVADDNERVRQGVVRLISSHPDCIVCGEAIDGADAIAKARELRPDVVLIDVSMPGLSGLEAARRVHHEVPETKIIVMSQHDPDQLLPQVLAVGGLACVDKGRLATDLLVVIGNLAEK